MAPETNPQENYLSQWGCLQLSFNDLWRGIGLQDPIPLLAGLDLWTLGSRVWNQNTAQILNLQGADAWRLFEELQADLRDGLTQVYNHRAPREDLAADWQNLGQLNQADAATNGHPAAAEQFAGNQLLPAMDPLAAIEPYAEYQPSAAFDPASPFAPRPAFDPFAGVDPSAIWEPTPTFEVQASSTEPLSASPSPGMMAPDAGDFAFENENGLSSSPGPSLHGGPGDGGEDFQNLLDSAYVDQNVAPLPAQVDQNDQQGFSAFDNSFLDDAARLNNTSIDELFFTNQQPAQPVAQQSPPAPDAVDPEELSAAELAEDFEKFCNDPNYWLS